MAGVDPSASALDYGLCALGPGLYPSNPAAGARIADSQPSDVCKAFMAVICTIGGSDDLQGNVVRRCCTGGYRGMVPSLSVNGVRILAKA